MAGGRPAERSPRGIVHTGSGSVARSSVSQSFSPSFDQSSGLSAPQPVNREGGPAAGLSDPGLCDEPCPLSKRADQRLRFVLDPPPAFGVGSAGAGAGAGGLTAGGAALGAGVGAGLSSVLVGVSSSSSGPFRGKGTL